MQTSLVLQLVGQPQGKLSHHKFDLLPYFQMTFVPPFESGIYAKAASCVPTACML